MNSEANITKKDWKCSQERSLSDWLLCVITFNAAREDRTKLNLT